ncbi:hypothetical protein G6F31_016666 [Rhizopus arrhizus]|nr:hypothetical protein G6F31_016666 [Rhizopus arrhizus]
MVLTVAMPRVPPAPARFSTPTLWPNSLRRPAATARASTSVDPPGANGTTSVTARSGNALAATAGKVQQDAAARAVHTAPATGLIFIPGLLGWPRHCGSISRLEAPMDALSDLAFFSLVVKHGNLSATARELGLTPPAISARLARLEQRLGVRLLNRTTRRVSVTQEGELASCG